MDGGRREGTCGLWGQPCCWNASAVLPEMCSEGKDRCSCSLLKMPTRLTSLPLSSTRRVDSRGNSEAHSSSKPHSVVPLKTYREKRMAQGGERNGQSYATVMILPREMFTIFQTSSLHNPPHTRSFVAIWRQSPILLQKVRKSCIRPLLPRQA